MELLEYLPQGEHRSRIVAVKRLTAIRAGITGKKRGQHEPPRPDAAPVIGLFFGVSSG